MILKIIALFLPSITLVLCDNHSVVAFDEEQEILDKTKEKCVNVGGSDKAFEAYRAGVGLCLGLRHILTTTEGTEKLKKDKYDCIDVVMSTANPCLQGDQLELVDYTLKDLIDHIVPNRTSIAKFDLSCLASEEFRSCLGEFAEVEISDNAWLDHLPLYLFISGDYNHVAAFGHCFKGIGCEEGLQELVDNFIQVRVKHLLCPQNKNRTENVGTNAVVIFLSYLLTLITVTYE